MFYFEDSVNFPLKYIILIWYFNVVMKCLQASSYVHMVVMIKSILQWHEEEVPKTGEASE
jgi:hypothetical protein